MLTAIYLCKNNEKTLERSLESIKHITNKIIVVDMFSTDSTPKIAKKYDAEIIFKDYPNLSNLRNEIIKNIKDGWILSLEPWERIISGYSRFESIMMQNPSCNRFNTLQSGILTKEIKMWHHSLPVKYINPIFETIEPCVSQYQDIYLEAMQLNSVEIEKINNWKKGSPTAAEPYYYEAFHYLKIKNYQKFKNSAESYFFRRDRDVPSIMLKYYLGIIELYNYENIKRSIELAVTCLREHILMAEFWSLLGDSYYKAKDYKKAIKFYENAIILGGFRSKEDEWPVEIDKYKAYPNKMIQSCRDILENSKLYQNSTSSSLITAVT